MSENKEAEYVHIVMMVAEDGAMLPVTAHKDLGRAEARCRHLNSTHTDEWGNETISTVRALGGTAVFVRTMKVNKF